MTSSVQYVGYLQCVRSTDNERENEEEVEGTDSVVMDNEFGKGKNKMVLREGTFAPFTRDGTGAVFNIRGKLHFTQPWWKLKFKLSKEKDARKHRRGMVTMLDGYLSYELRNDTGTENHHFVMQMLTECGIQENAEAADQDAKMMFINYLNSRNRLKSLRMENVMENLHDMKENSYQDDRKAAAERMINALEIVAFQSNNENGGQGRQQLQQQQQQQRQQKRNKHYPIAPYQDIKMARKYPDIYRFGAKLFTTKFYSVLLTVHMELVQKEKKMEEFAKAFEEKPWILGFYRLLMRSFHIAAEADLVPLVETGLFDKIKETLYRDALLIYSTLKKANMTDGHTYLTVPQIKKHYSLARASIKRIGYITDMDVALDWLVKESIVVREEWGKEDRVSLWLWYNYEKTIAEGLTSLVEKHKANPLKFDVDFDREEFSNFRQDDDQMAALKAICKHPVVIMSGKGGCGKTATVSVLLNYVKRSCMLEERERSMEPSDEMYGDDGFDDMDDSKQHPPITKTETPKATSKAANKSKIIEPESFLHLWDSLREEDFASEMEEFGPETETETQTKKEKLKVDDEPLVLLGAPTGKAASVLRKKSELNAQTLHHIYMTYDADMAKTPEDGSDPKWRYGRVRVFVVDEGSMVPISVFSKCLKYLAEHAQLEKIVILGDILQLPSIEAGKFLADVFPCFDRYGVSIPLRTCHRASSELIVANAHRISRRSMPVFDDARRFHFVEILEEGPGSLGPRGGRGGKGRGRGRGRRRGGRVANDAPSMEEAVEELAQEADNDLEWRIDNTVRPLIKAQPNLQDDKKSHFITFTRKRVRQLNEICCRIYNFHSLVDHQNHIDFRPGDKLCITKNGAVSVQTSKLVANPGGGEPETAWKGDQQKFYNGEIFFLSVPEVMCPTQGYDRCLYEPGGDSFVVNIQSVRDVCEIQHGWVTTIHKFQGSEADTIVYVVHGGRYENWQHMYTAITRAKQCVYIVGTEETIKKVLENPVTERQTNLKDLLSRNLDELDLEGKKSRASEGHGSQNEDSQNSETEILSQLGSFDEDQSFINVLGNLQQTGQRDSEQFDSGKCTQESQSQTESQNVPKGSQNVQKKSQKAPEKKAFGASICDGFSSDEDLEEYLNIQDVSSQQDIQISDFTPAKPNRLRIESVTPSDNGVVDLTPIRHVKGGKSDLRQQQRGVSASTPRVRVEKGSKSDQETVQKDLVLTQFPTPKPSVSKTEANNDYISKKSDPNLSDSNQSNKSTTNSDSHIWDASDNSNCSGDLFDGSDSSIHNAANENASRKRRRGTDSDSPNGHAPKAKSPNVERFPKTPDRSGVLTPPNLTPNSKNQNSPENGFQSPRTPLRRAAFPGWCRLCRSPIKVEEMLSVLEPPKTSQNSSRWVHAQCPHENPTEQNHCQLLNRPKD